MVGTRIGQRSLPFSLEDMGVNNYVGFEKEETLLELEAFVAPEKVSISRVSLGEIIRANQADVICSFFCFRTRRKPVRTY